MKKSVISVSMLLTISMHCKCQSIVDSIQKQLLGKWFSTNQRASIEFSKDKIYKVFLNNAPFYTENYRMEVLNDSIFSYHYNSQLRTDDAQYDTTKYLLYLNCSELLQVNYKNGLGINEHIDEFYFFYKQGANPILQNPKEIKTIDYVLTPNFIGEIKIAYTGERTEKNSDKQLIKIPHSGLLERAGREDIQSYARQHFRFFYQNEGNDSKTAIKKLDLSAKYSAQELKTYNENDVFVLALGYNQVNRQEVNTLFGKEIVGNVEFYIVDAFKNLIKYLDK